MYFLFTLIMGDFGLLEFVFHFSSVYFCLYILKPRVKEATAKGSMSGCKCFGIRQYFLGYQISATGLVKILLTFAYVIFSMYW